MSNQYRRNKRELLKDACLQYLGGKRCVICDNISEMPCCYDFHHMIGTKGENISKMITNKKNLDSELKTELDKCAIICANCHRQITNRTIPLETLKKIYT